MARHEDFEIPGSWPASDVRNWIEATLDEEGVASIEFFREGGKLIARVHYKK